MPEKKFETIIGEHVELALVTAAPAVGRVVTAALTAAAIAAGSKYFMDAVRTARIAYANSWRTMRAWAEAFKEVGGLAAAAEAYTALRAVKAAVRSIPKDARGKILEEYAGRFPNEALLREAAKWGEEAAKAEAFFENPFAMPSSAAPSTDIPEASSVELSDLEEKVVN